MECDPRKAEGGSVSSFFGGPSCCYTTIIYIYNIYCDILCIYIYKLIRIDAFSSYDVFILVFNVCIPWPCNDSKDVKPKHQFGFGPLEGTNWIP